MSLLADALGVARLAAAAAFPSAIANATSTSVGGWGPAVLVGIAAGTDFLDGRLARRAGRTTAHGAVLDNVADIAFVLAASGSAAAYGLVPVAAPGAILVSVLAYVLASWRTTARAGDVRLARSRAGHAAGVVNYVLAVLIAGAVALPAGFWDVLLRLASLVVVAVNLAAVVERGVPGPVTRARVRPVEGSRGRSSR